MSETMSARITDQGRAYVAWLDSLGDEEPTRTGAFAAGVEWERGRGRALTVAMRYHAAVETLLNHMGADSEDGAHDEPSDAERDEYEQARAALEVLAKEQGEPEC